MKQIAKPFSELGNINERLDLHEYNLVDIYKEITTIKKRLTKQEDKKRVGI